MGSTQKMQAKAKPPMLRPTLPLIAAAITVMISGLAFAQSLSRSQESNDCLKADGSKRIEGCTKLLERQLEPDQQSLAFAMRALAYSLQGRYDEAIADYDAALEINPKFASALNNRAWTYFKSGQPERGLPDVERSLSLSPTSAHAYDTRAHIRQSLGDPTGALKDYERAMNYGGPRLVRAYQCGLQSQGLFTGPVTGIATAEFNEAMEECVNDKSCDPLPPDEDCRKLTS